MRFQIIFALGLVALAGATPLVDKRHGSLKVVDIPADLFAEESENVETVQVPEEKKLIGADEAAAAAAIPEEKASEPVEPAVVKEGDEKKDDDKKEVVVDAATPSNLDGKEDDKKPEAGEAEDGDRQSIFGFRLPTIIIVRRPQIFDDPFSSFSPFGLPFFNRRPSFGPPPSVNRDVEIRDGEEERPNVAATSPSQQRPISVGGSSGAGIADVMHNVRQHMDNLFSSLFAPNAGFFPNRQFFPRPMFPPVPVDSSAEDESVDFDKLPDNYKNSTSETKIVDGKVVQVNRTIHKISGNNSNGFFQFSVIKIRPDAPAAEEETAPAAIEEKNVGSAAPEVTTIKAQQEAEMNNPSLNEVDQQQEKEKLSNTKYETDPGLLEEPKSESAPISLPLTQEVVYDFVPLQSMPLIEATKSGQGKKPHDLSSDLRVNNIMANQENVRLRTLVDPDEIEVIEL